MSLIKKYIWFPILALIVLCVYFKGLNISYYSDDFQFVFFPIPSSIFEYFIHKNPLNNFAYRPIQASLMILTQQYFGTNTLPIHLMSITTHIFLTWLIYHVMVRLGFSTLQAIIGSIFMAVSQANVHAVLSNDTLSQIMGTFFGCMSLWLLYKAYLLKSISGRMNVKLFFASIVLMGFAMFSKETSISLLLGLFFIAFLCNFRRRSYKRAVIEIIPFGIITVFYFLARFLVVDVQPSLGMDRYQFHLGINIVKNTVQYFVAAFSPISTVFGYFAMKSGDIVQLSIFSMTIMVFISAIVYGLIRSNKYVVIFVCLALIGSLPVVLLNHVSELYVYNSMPFISIIVGISLGGVFELTKTGWKKYFFQILLAGLFINNIFAIQSKASLMQHNGKRASELIGEIMPYVDNIPQNGILLLLNPPDDKMEYSVFVINNFNVLYHRIKQLSPRDDFDIKIIDKSDLLQINNIERQLILTLKDDKVVMYHDDRN